MRRTSGGTITLTTAETYQKLTGTFEDGVCNCFTLDTNGKLTFDGDQSMDFLFTGVSDLQAYKTCTVSYALYLNGVLVSDSVTPTTFSHANAIKNISISRIVQLNQGDEIEVYVKSDTASTIIEIKSFNITFWGE